MKATDAIYDLEVVNDLTAAGCGDGNLEVFDNNTGKCLYGFGVIETGGIRCLEITPDYKKYFSYLKNE